MSDFPDPILNATCELFLRSLPKTNPAIPGIVLPTENVPFESAALQLKQAITVHLLQGGALESFDYAAFVAQDYAADLSVPVGSTPGKGFAAMAAALQPQASATVEAEPAPEKDSRKGASS
jgi:hypothetical protein